VKDRNYKEVLKFDKKDPINKNENVIESVILSRVIETPSLTFLPLSRMIHLIVRRSMSPARISKKSSRKEVEETPAQQCLEGPPLWLEMIAGSMSTM
jgi:hypothetical protein